MRLHLFRAVSLDEVGSSPDFPVADSRATAAEAEDASPAHVPTLEARLTASLSQKVLALTLLWTRDIMIEIASVQVREKNGQSFGPWRETLTQRYFDDDGEFSHPLGSFEPGITVQVRVIAMAIEADVPDVAVFVSAGPGHPVKQVIPPDPGETESMARGTTWIKTGEYTA